jgi:integrase/recombinase XerD
MRSLMVDCLDWLRVRGHTEASIDFRAHCLHYFASWGEERGITRAQEVTRPILQRYQRWLFYYRKKNGQPLGVSTQHGRLVVVSIFFRWATRENHLLYNPASELELPRTEKRLPKDVLTVAEVEKVLATPDLASPLGLRDRAILEVFYSTGARRKELVALKVTSIDRERGTMMIRLGKGKKDRVVPIGERAIAFVDRYVNEARPGLVVEPDAGWLFLGSLGGPLGHSYVGDLVRSYVDAAALGKRGSCHLLRHTMATLMLEGGADTRFIQAMLGHEQLSSTQIYTQVAIRTLKAIHAATHPGAMLDGGPRRKELLSSLAAEAAGHGDAPG